MFGISLNQRDYVDRPAYLKSIPLYFLPLVYTLLLFFVDKTSIISYVYALSVSYVSSRFICKNEFRDLFFAFHFYMIFATAFYSYFLYIDHGYMGCYSDGEGFILDDQRFYAQLSDVPLEYFSHVIVDDESLFMGYSKLLRLYYPFKVYTPLNIVTSSLVFSAYLPIVARRLAILITEDQGIGYYTFWFTMLCPFTLFYGCIILRESYTAVLVLAGLCCFIERKYILLFVCVLGILYIRMGTIFFLVVGILLLYRFEIKRKLNNDVLFVAIFIVILVVFNLYYETMQEISNGKLGDSIIRNISAYNNTTIQSLTLLPFPINIVLCTLFFLFIPFLSFSSIISFYQDNNVHVIEWFISFAFPLFMFFLWNYIYNAAISAIKEHDEALKKILFCVILFAMGLGTVSLQSRHKTVLCPMLCMLAAYGKVKYNIRWDNESKILTGVTIGANLIYAFMGIK